MLVNSKLYQEGDLPAALKTIGHLHHGVSDRISGITREFPSNFANRGPRDSSDALLYQLSYLGEATILRGNSRANRVV